MQVLQLDGLSEKYGQSPYDYITGHPLRFAFDYSVALTAAGEREKEKRTKAGGLTRRQKQLQMNRMKKQFPELERLVKAAAGGASASRD